MKYESFSPENFENPKEKELHCLISQLPQKNYGIAPLTYEQLTYNLKELRKTKGLEFMGTYEGETFILYDKNSTGIERLLLQQNIPYYPFDTQKLDFKNLKKNQEKILKAASGDQ